ncbi:MAG: hypothetical protein ACK55I_34100, partial [bacterium]
MDRRTIARGAGQRARGGGAAGSLKGAGRGGGCGHCCGTSGEVRSYAALPRLLPCVLIPPRQSPEPIFSIICSVPFCLISASGSS